MLFSCPIFEYIGKFLYRYRFTLVMDDQGFLFGNDYALQKQSMYNVKILFFSWSLFWFEIN